MNSCVHIAPLTPLPCKVRSRDRSETSIAEIKAGFKKKESCGNTICQDRETKMDPPQVQSIDTSTAKNFPPPQDEQDKTIDDCCSCFYDCMGSCLESLFCSDCCD
nr:hypothetical protein BC332_05704 [Ipomoea batatas]